MWYSHTISFLFQPYHRRDAILWLTMAHIEIIARGVWIQAGQILLCRNVAGEYWYLPGGHVDAGESAASALRREFVEETGIKPVIGGLRLVMENMFRDSRKRHHELLLVFHVEHEDDSPPPPISSLEPDIAFDWVDLAGIVEIDLRPLSIRAWLASGGRVEQGPGTGWISQVEGSGSG